MPDTPTGELADLLGRHVRVWDAQHSGVFVEGPVVAYNDRPTVFVEDDCPSGCGTRRVTGWSTSLPIEILPTPPEQRAASHPVLTLDLTDGPALWFIGDDATIYRLDLVALDPTSPIPARQRALAEALISIAETDGALRSPPPPVKLGLQPVESR